MKKSIALALVLGIMVVATSCEKDDEWLNQIKSEVSYEKKQAPKADTVRVNDTVTVVMRDTLVNTVILPQDTVVVNDTIIISNVDTLLITNTVVDTLTLVVRDTVTVTNTEIVNDTLIVTETVTINDTVWVPQTVVVNDTIWQDNYILQTDTVTVTNTVTETVHDTVTVVNTEIVNDTIWKDNYILQTDTVTVTNTVTETVRDTVTITNTVTETVRDTVTITNTVTETVRDTVTITNTETVTDTVYVPVTQTEVVVKIVRDTVTVTNTEVVNDTVWKDNYILQTDTVTVTNTVTETVHDTVTVTNTVTETVHDTVYVNKPEDVKAISLVQTVAPSANKRSYFYTLIVRYNDNTMLPVVIDRQGNVTTFDKVANDNNINGLSLNRAGEWVLTKAEDAAENITYVTTDGKMNCQMSYTVAETIGWDENHMNGTAANGSKYCSVKTYRYSLSGEGVLLDHYTGATIAF